MKVGLAVLGAFLIPAAFFTPWMAEIPGQRVATITPIGSIEFDFSILALVLLLANDFMCFAANHDQLSSLLCGVTAKCCSP